MRRIPNPAITAVTAVTLVAVSGLAAAAVLHPSDVTIVSPIPGLTVAPISPPPPDAAGPRPTEKPTSKPTSSPPGQSPPTESAPPGQQPTSGPTVGSSETPVAPPTDTTTAPSVTPPTEPTEPTDQPTDLPTDVPTDVPTTAPPVPPTTAPPEPTPTETTPTPVVVVSVDISPASVSLTLGTTTRLTATATYSDGTTRDVSAEVAWSSTDLLRIDAAGLVTPLLVGTGTVTATLGGSSATATVEVGAALLDTVTLDPLGGFVAAGTEQRFTLTARYADGTTADVSSQATWSSSDPSIATVDGGLLTAKVPGLVLVTAVLGDRTRVAAVTVTAPEVEFLTVSPGDQTLVLGATATFTATTRSSDDSTADVTADALWESDDPTVATVDQTGLVTAVGAGTARVTARTAGLTSAPVTITVPAATLTDLAVVPLAPSLPVNATQQLTAIGSYSDDSTTDVTAQARWESDAADVATVDQDGMVTGVGPGTATITARLDGREASTVVEVTAVTLRRVTVQPSTTTVAVGVDAPFTATAVYSDGTEVDVTTDADWSSDDDRVATVDRSGTATGRREGTASITASYEGVTSEPSSLAVTAAELRSIILAPTESDWPVGFAFPLTATGRYTDGSDVDLTAEVDWASGDDEVATVSARGRVDTRSEGRTTITASLDGVTSERRVVDVQAVAALTLTPREPSLVSGTSLDLEVRATLDGGRDLDVTDAVEWTSSQPDVATALDGRLSALSPGTTTITATFGGRSDSSRVEVTPAALESISVSRVSGDTSRLQLKAVGHYADGSTADLTDDVRWSSRDPQIATVDQDGVVRPVSEGSTSITVTRGDLVSEPYTVTVRTVPR